LPDLNRSGVVVGYVVEIIGSAHDHRRSSSCFGCAPARSQDVAVSAERPKARSAASAGSAAGRRIDGEAAKLPLQSQVVGLECARVDVAKNQVGCPSYVGFVRPSCRTRRSRRFAESSPTAPTKAELDLVVADAVEAPARAVRLGASSSPPDSGLYRWNANARPMRYPTDAFAFGMQYRLGKLREPVINENSCGRRSRLNS
jgi:hypothetical protein